MKQKTNSKTTQQVVINEIIVKSPSRRTADVGEWRSALKLADTGRVRSLYELYEDMLGDGTLSDAISKRTDAVLNSNLVFLDNKGKEVQEIADIIDSEEFETLQSTILACRMWGRSGIELGMEEGIKAGVIPPKHIDLLHQGIIPDLLNPERIIPYTGRSNVIVLGKHLDYGLILKAIPFAIYKRGGFGDWAQWIELFGMPQRVGKYNTHDPRARAELEAVFEAAGSASWIIAPKDAEVEVKETNPGNGNAFDQFRRACNEEMLIAILGQTMTTVAGERGARSLGEVHKAVEEGKNKSDMRFVQRILNARVVPFLEARGLPVRGGRFLFPDVAESIDVSELVQLSRIVPIPASYIRDKYGIPAPEEGEEIAGEMQIEVPEPEPVQEPEPEPGEKGEEKKDDQKQQKQKKKGLRDFFVVAPRRAGQYMTRLRDSITGRITLADDYSIDIRRLIEEALREVYNDPYKPISSKVFETNNTPLQEGIKKVFAESGFGERNEEFIEEFKRNTAVFNAFKSHAQTRAMVEALYDEKGNLRSFAQYKKVARGICGKYNENWLRTEYNTAVRAARSAVNYRDALRTEHLYPNLEYLESSASNQREEHLEWVGTVLPIRHPWWDEHMPPSEWNCACSVKPTDKPVTPVPGADLKLPAALRNNPGKSAAPFKLSEHPYLKGKGSPACPECRRLGLVQGEGDTLCPMHAIANTDTSLVLLRKLEYKQLLNDKKYKDVDFDEKTGGLIATHIAHNFDKHKGWYEKRVQEIGFKRGHKIIFGEERGLEFGVKHTEGTWDDIPFEIAAAETGTANNIKRALAHCAKKEADIAVVFSPYLPFTDLQNGVKKYLGLKNIGGEYRSFRKMIFISNDSEIVEIKNPGTW